MTGPTWWAPLDVSAWKGKNVTIQVDALARRLTGAHSDRTETRSREARSLYREPLRGQFHFSPKPRLE